MASLRQRMLEDMQVRRLSPCTQRTYVETVARFARYFDRSPARLGPEDIRAYQVHLTTERRLATSSLVVDVAAPMVSEAQARYPELRACSFDRGFHSPDNRIKLDALLDLNVLPTKGYLSRADREREAEEPFAVARRAHPAIESAINGLEHRGLDRVRSHGADGFARTVALSVLAANLHRIGLILQQRERKRRRLAA